jgi:hypothetical protein
MEEKNDKRVKTKSEIEKDALRIKEEGLKIKEESLRIKDDSLNISKNMLDYVSKEKENDLSFLTKKEKALCYKIELLCECIATTYGDVVFIEGHSLGEIKGVFNEEPFLF